MTTTQELYEEVNELFEKLDSLDVDALSHDERNAYSDAHSGLDDLNYRLHQRMFAENFAEIDIEDAHEHMTEVVNNLENALSTLKPHADTLDRIDLSVRPRERAEDLYSAGERQDERLDEIERLLRETATDGGEIPDFTDAIQPENIHNGRLDVLHTHGGLPQVDIWFEADWNDETHQLVASADIYGIWTSPGDEPQREVTTDWLDTDHDDNSDQ